MGPVGHRVGTCARAHVRPRVLRRLGRMFSDVPAPHPPGSLALPGGSVQAQTRLGGGRVPEARTTDHRFFGWEEERGPDALDWLGMGVE